MMCSIQVHEPVHTQPIGRSDVAIARVLPTSGGTRLCLPAIFRDEGFLHFLSFGILTCGVFPSSVAAHHPVDTEMEADSE